MRFGISYLSLQCERWLSFLNIISSFKLYYVRETLSDKKTRLKSVQPAQHLWWNKINHILIFIHWENYLQQSFVEMSVELLFDDLHLCFYAVKHIPTGTESREFLPCFSRVQNTYAVSLIQRSQARRCQWHCGVKYGVSNFSKIFLQLKEKASRNFWHSFFMILTQLDPRS